MKGTPELNLITHPLEAIIAGRYTAAATACHRTMPCRGRSTLSLGMAATCSSREQSPWKTLRWRPGGDQSKNTKAAWWAVFSLDLVFQYLILVAGTCNQLFAP